MKKPQNKYWRVLEQRYGQVETDAVSRFGKKYFNGIQGWQFPAHKIRKANRESRLLTMDLDFPGDKCLLDCVYCFAKVGEKTGTYYRPNQGNLPLTVRELRTFLRKAKKIGLQSAKVIGYREPFEHPDFLDFIDFTSKQGIWLVVFTAGYTLGEDHFGGDLGKAIDWLAARKVSLMIKLHTLDRRREDKIVHLRGFSHTRDKILRKLLEDDRFTNQNPTRLGIENVISSQNVEELVNIYEYFKVWSNVFVDIDPPIPMGRTGTLEEAEKAGLMPQKKLKDLCVRIYKVNQKYGIATKGISPYFGGNPCTQLTNGLYLTLSGKVMTCCGGDEELGNIRKDSLKQILARHPYRQQSSIFHNCPYREKRGIMTKEFIKQVEAKLN